MACQHTCASCLAPWLASAFAIILAFLCGACARQQAKENRHDSDHGHFLVWCVWPALTCVRLSCSLLLPFFFSLFLLPPLLCLKLQTYNISHLQHLLITFSLFLLLLPLRAAAWLGSLFFPARPTLPPHALLYHHAIIFPFFVAVPACMLACFLAMPAMPACAPPHCLPSMAAGSGEAGGGTCMQQHTLAALFQAWQTTLPFALPS